MYESFWSEMPLGAIHTIDYYFVQLVIAIGMFLFQGSQKIAFVLLQIHSCGIVDRILNGKSSRYNSLPANSLDFDSKLSYEVSPICPAFNKIDV